MIIVEGMDGSGKTNLVARLKRDLGIPQAERASTSVGGPVQDICDWARVDVARWPELPVQIYDRHPFISELIYGPVVRGVIDPEFFSLSSTRMRELFTRDALIIFCHLPWEQLQNNLANTGNQMPGVVSNAKTLWLNYQVFMSTLRQNQMANIRTWNYTHTNYTDVLAACERHVKNWMEDANV
jgi:hypothetical protein